MVGLLGELRFRVADSRILTFRNFKREIASTWNSLDRIGLKPIVEYGGANLQTASFEIVLDASLGVRPSKLLKTLEQMAEAAQAYELVIGKKMIGKNKWVITKCSQAYDYILRGGEIYRATVSLTLQEYV
ncbi:MAG: phage tail protein [Clostridiaceae bacterium]|uniref:Phage tail protein n=1 Tax=Clostridium porci TaxID=2605778 RepID=A0A7X2NKI7_9CLOT|nr:phage tail protein [Clostridium porci]MDY3230602.1 phage tail protein [Clostridiaceae bacterium]MSS36601.1 phage tail protein [Clostridium porci]